MRYGASMSVPRRSSVVYKQIGIALPTALSGRLDALVSAANLAGEKTSRRELVAALVSTGADERIEDIQNSLRTYRRARLSDAYIAPYDPGIFLHPDRSRG